MTIQLLEGFEPPKPFEHGNIVRQLYVSSKGAVPLIVLHELPGMSPSFIGYCSRMADQGYKVYMPLLFKTPNTEMNLAQSLIFSCISKEFRELFATKGSERHTRPFTVWMLNLVGEVREQHPQAKFGIVGMCLTGGFALAAIADPGVHAAIACQPGIPFFRHISTLGLSKSERRNALIRAQTLPKPCAKGYRYAKDRVCRERHMKAATTILGDAFARYPDLPGEGHSTLTGSTANESVFSDVLDFLNRRLKQA